MGFIQDAVKKQVTKKAIKIGSNIARPQIQRAMGAREEGEIIKEEGPESHHILFVDCDFTAPGTRIIRVQESNRTYEIKSASIFGRMTHRLLDANRDEVGVVREVRAFLQDGNTDFEVEIGGKEIGTISRSIVKMKYRYDLRFCDWKIDGNFWKTGYSITRGDETIAELRMAVEERKHRRETRYILDYPNEENEIILILISIILLK